MGKKSPSFIFETVFKDITNIQDIIKNSKKVKKQSEQVNFSDKSEVQKLFEDTKSIVSSIKDEATKIDDYFNENYSTWQTQLNHSDRDTSDVIPEANSTNSEPDSETPTTTSDNCEIVDKSAAQKEPSNNQVSNDVNVAPDKDDQPNSEIQNSESNKGETIAQSTTENRISENPPENGENVNLVVANGKDCETRNTESNTNDVIINKPGLESKDFDQSKKGSDQSNKGSDQSNTGSDQSKKDSDESQKLLIDNTKDATNNKDGSDQSNTGSDRSKKDSDESQKRSDQSKKASDQNKEDPHNNILIDNTKDCELEDDTNNKGSTIDESVIENEVPSTNSVVNVKSEDYPKPFIKCVDITKLVNPKVLPGIKSTRSKPTVALNDTILIVSDSDTDDASSKIKRLPEISINRSTKKISLDGEKGKTAPIAKVSVKDKNLNRGSFNKRTDDAKTNSNKEKSGKRRKLADKLDSKFLDNESSSASEAEVEKVQKTTRTKPSKSKKLIKENIDLSLDKKFHCEAYVSLLRIPCENLKKYYKTMAELKDVRNLTNLKTLKRLRFKTDSPKSSSSESEKRRPSKKRKTDGAKPHSPSSSSNSETDNNVSNKDEAEIANKDDKRDDTNNDAMLLDDIQPASDSSENERENAKHSENEDDTCNKDKSEKEKEKVRKSKDKHKKSQKDKNSKTDNDGKWRKDKLLTEKLPDVCSDSEDERGRINSKTDASKEVNKDLNGDTSDRKNEETGDKTDPDKQKNNGTDENESDPEEEKKEKTKKSKEKENQNADSDTTSEKNNKNKSSIHSNSSSDSEEEVIKFKKQRSKLKENTAKKVIKKRAKNVIASSGSEYDEKDDENESSSSSESENENSKKKAAAEKEPDNKKRRRIKRVDDSSTDEETKSTRKTIRKMIAHDSLAETTKQAEKDEKERKARIAERQKKYNQIFEEDEPLDASVDKVVLDFDEKTKKELLSVHDHLVSKLKPHQAKGIQFMWDACFESLKRAQSTDGSGCILAHCMGLGKTLQVIALIYALLTKQEKTKVEKVLVVTPVNTVLNWVSEFKKWLRGIDGPEIDVYDLVSVKQNRERKYKVEEWASDGGVLIVGYDMYRNLTNPTNKRMRKTERASFEKCLVNPGPDLVVCDEGHLLKNEKSNLSIAMNRIRTLRRIVLTGTPMQNNLKEYYCMVQFVKPNLLGTYREYLNRFVNPITNGQYTDSTQHDTNIMKKRSHVLHKLLDGVVQRRDYSVLTPYLPPKYEYVLFLTLSEVQIKLYRYYLENYSRRPMEDAKMRTTSLFNDFQEFQRICTHPRALLLKSEADSKKALNYDTEEESEGSLKDFIDDNSEASTSTNSSSNSDDSDSGSVKSINSDTKKKAPKQRRRITRNVAAAEGIEVIAEPLSAQIERKEQWWDKVCSEKELEDIALSTKLFVLFKILQECELIGDKLLVFSQSLYSLSIIEHFLDQIDEATQNNTTDKVCGFSGSWALGQDYFRLDGSSSCDNRSAWCKVFNNPDNPRARLFLISTKAGGLGINLVGANRVVIFDVSWNPSHDIQSIYRIYRFGQTKPCYIYRFVTNGTMEMKIYERQVTKQAISKRVIDEQQIDRHYNQTDLAELYLFDPKPESQPTPMVPKDVLLAELIQKDKDKIFTYHEHQSLLENKEDEELNEEERKAAWEEFENEKTFRATTNAAGGWINNLPISGIRNALLHILSKDNPTWTRDQINTAIPIIVQQLKEQVDKGDVVLYNRIVNQLRELQAAQQKRMQEYYMQQQIQLLQQRFAQQRQMSAQQFMQQGGVLNSYLAGPSRAQSRSASAGIQPTEIVDLDVNEV